MTRARLTTTVLGVLAVALALAFVVLPRPAASALSGRSYGDQQHLAADVTSSFVDYWQRGGTALTPRLSHLVEYWRWYLGVKAVTATALLVVLIVLAVRCWRAYARTGRHERAWPMATGGLVATVLALPAFAVAMATVQGTVAPFSSLMSMLPVTSARGDLAVMVGQVRHALARYPHGSPGTLRTMVGDLATYHLVVALISWVTALTLVALTVVWWRNARRSTGERRTRRLVGPFAVASALMAALVAVLGLANTTTALDSPTAVLNFYQGSY